ncbi:unnamed protein product [Rhodiola kirilowii]
MSALMAYVPKNKRQSHDAYQEDPTPALLTRQFNRNLSLGSSSSKFNSYKKNDRHKRHHNAKIFYGKKATGMWFSVGLVNDYQIPYSITLKEVSLPSALWKGNNKVMLILENTEEGKTRDEPRLKSPWKSIAENVLEDVLSSFQKLKDEFNSQNWDELNPGIVVRFGKILFHGEPSFKPHTVKKSAVSENALRLLRRTFYTTVPSSYVENIITHVVPEIGFDTKVEKESYRIKLSDSEQPDATIICECKVTADGKGIELYKIEMNQVRHLVVDVSCFGKNLDMRLMLAKRNSDALIDKEMQSIRLFISSAILDSNVNGWLRWPIGMACYGLRYRVIGVWHIKCITYKKSSMRLRMRDVDRYDYQSSTEDFAREVVLKHNDIGSKLKGPNVDDSSLMDTLKDYLKLIWERFLDCDKFLKSDQILS